MCVCAHMCLSTGNYYFCKSFSFYLNNLRRQKSVFHSYFFFFFLLLVKFILGTHLGSI